jgi:hypothetical protein
MTQFQVGQRVKYIGDENKDFPVLQKGHFGSIWSVGVGKSWIWATFDGVDRPVAVHHKEVTLLTEED